jgi:D-glycero-alpha-D-manno-heptose 1-phosphate guanylyltransferase
MSVRPDQITAVVLAGGFGTRIKHLLGDLPKPMAPVNGKPFVEWVVRYLAAQGIRNVILSTGHLAETVEKHFAPQPVKNIRVSCVPETSPLGTAGGFLNAANSAKEKPAAWLVLNGDSLVVAPLEKLFGTLNQPENEGAILGVPMADASRFGTISRNADGDLTGFNEKKPGAGDINAGVYLFRDSALKKFPAKTPLSFELDVFPSLIRGGAKLKTVLSEAPFLDIGTPESLPQAEDFIRKIFRILPSEIL